MFSPIYIGWRLVCLSPKVSGPPTMLFLYRSYKSLFFPSGTTQGNREKIWKIWKKGKFNSEKIWKIQKQIDLLFFPISISFHYSTYLSVIISISFHNLFLYFPYLFTIQLAFLPYFSYLFTISSVFSNFFHYSSCLSYSDKIWTIWMKGKLNSEKIWKIQKKPKLNC
jgi:hypothetical protein